MEIKDKIIEGASGLFHQYGIRSVSMDDIARSLSISKKTIYQYFKDKDELVTTGIRCHMDQEKTEYDEIFEMSHNAVEELSLVNQCMRRNMRDLNPSLLFDMQKYHPNAWNIWLDFKNDFIKNSIIRNLKRGIEEGYFREELNVEIMAVLRVEQVQMAFDNKIFPTNKFDFREVQMDFLDHYIHGIVTDKGLQLYEEYLENEKLNPQNS